MCRTSSIAAAPSLHGDHLLLPYGVADNCIAFATLPLAALLSALQAS